MKKLATLLAAASLSLAAPAFACPHEDAAAPRTAEKAKDAPAADKAKEAAPKTEAPKQEAPKTETAKAKPAPKKEEPKKATKVSQK
jgi:hypothetical protein